MSNRSFIFAAAIAAALGGAAFVPSTASAVTVHVPSVQVHISLPKGGGATTAGRLNTGRGFQTHDYCPSIRNHCRRKSGSSFFPVRPRLCASIAAFLGPQPRSDRRHRDLVRPALDVDHRLMVAAVRVAEGNQSPDAVLPHVPERHGAGLAGDAWFHQRSVAWRRRGRHVAQLRIGEMGEAPVKIYHAPVGG